MSEKRNFATPFNNLNSHYDLVIIGSGINGAGVLRDAALHGLKTLLIEKDDFFSGQTSSKSSKMLHGGVRYLQNFDFPLVKEALEEKKIWLKLAPHLCKPRQFLLPIFKDSPYKKWEIQAGMFLYDFLSDFSPPRTGVYPKEKTLELVPQLKSENLLGSGFYSDAVVDDQKLALYCIHHALQFPNIHATSSTNLKYVYELNERNSLFLQLKLQYQSVSNIEKNISCAHLVFCTGPFTDQLLPKIGFPNWKNKMLLSKGSHLWLSPSILKKPLDYNIVMQDKMGRVIFCNSYSDKILLGTTEEPWDQNESPASAEISHKETQYLLQSFHHYFPDSQLRRDTYGNFESQFIQGSFAGIRPLVKEDSAKNDRGKTSRYHKIFRPHPRCQVILGGKYTTFRSMCQDILRPILKSENKIYNKNLTLLPFDGSPLI